jgi:ribosomal protein S20
MTRRRCGGMSFACAPRSPYSGRSSLHEDPRNYLHMANNKSAIKRWHQSIRRRDRNRATRTFARGTVRRLREAVAAGDAAAVTTALGEAYSALDVRRRRARSTQGRPTARRAGWLRSWHAARASHTRTPASCSPAPVAACARPCMRRAGSVVSLVPASTLRYRNKESGHRPCQSVGAFPPRRRE